MTNIILIGMRGSGKSAIAKRLSKLTKYDLVDTDQLIVEKAKQSIPEIVTEHGWPFFRKLETEVTKSLEKLDNTIISTGGGIITSPENVEILKNLGATVYLEGTPKHLANRIRNSKNRPSLKEGLSLEQELEEVLKERKSLYEEASNFSINIDSSTNNKEKDINDKAELILSLVNVFANAQV